MCLGKYRVWNKFLSTYGATASSLNFATENFLAWCGSIDIIICKEVFGRETEELEEIEEKGEIQTSIKVMMLRAEQCIAMAL